MGIVQTVRRRRVAVAGIVALGIIGGTATTLVVRADDSGPDSPAAVASSTPTTDPAALAEQRMLAGMDAVLKARAEAVMTGRLDRFLAPIDPAETALRRKQTELFTNLRRLGLQSLTYRRQVPFVPMPMGPKTYGIQVAMFVQLRGIDAVPRMTTLGLTLAERPRGWMITGTDGGPYTAAATEPWDLGLIEVVRRGPVAVVVSAGERGNGERLATQAVAALQAVRGMLGRAPASGLIVAVRDRRSLDGASTGGHPALAVALNNVVPADPADFTRTRVVATRIAIQPAFRSKANRSLLAHELTHATLQRFGSGTPKWLVEGLAEYVEHRVDTQIGYSGWVQRYRREVVRDEIPGLKVLPIDGVFHGDFGENSYGVAWVVTEYLVGRYGMPVVLALYTDLARSEDDPDVRERLYRKHLHAGEAGIVAAVRRYRGPS